MNVLDNCVCEPAANIGEVFPFLKVLATDAPITFVTTVDRFLFPHPFFYLPGTFPSSNVDRLTFPALYKFQVWTPSAETAHNVHTDVLQPMKRIRSHFISTGQRVRKHRSPVEETIRKKPNCENQKDKVMFYSSLSFWVLSSSPGQSKHVWKTQTEHWVTAAAAQSADTVSPSSDQQFHQIHSQK